MKLIIEVDLEQMPRAGRAFADVRDALDNLERIIPDSIELPKLLREGKPYSLLMEGSCSRDPKHVSARFVIVRDKFVTRTLSVDVVNITPERT